MDVGERLRRIEQIVAAEETVTVADLADRFVTSEATIRRGLIELDRKGVLRRVHGGAKRLRLRGSEVSFASRAATNIEAKTRIAAEVVRRLTANEAVLLDSGTTCVEIARSIGDLPLRVMPLSLTSASVLAEADNVRLTTPGGDVRPGERSFVGPLTELCIRRLRFDTVIVSGCGVSLTNGVTAYDIGDATVKMTAIDCADRAILVCDSSKWDKTAVAWVAHLRSFDMVITDRRLSADELAFFKQHGVEAVIV
ncbi:DeoR/GlpR family DNA-binding transcription regulator [Actinoalloteichus hymeniacidonis]|nr:DeoR/GlpR family DNA-binding transcription regulator [Actinoalloteichus hymeniacidonis]MBB5907838.1 DeoR/GlpR family transcriptional regulator of sugar metabolism [Actinoalloteichus hymeniacidonis]